jgi:hypothetical protein
MDKSVLHLVLCIHRIWDFLFFIMLLGQVFPFFFGWFSRVQQAVTCTGNQSLISIYCLVLAEHASQQDLVFSLLSQCALESVKTWFFLFPVTSGGNLKSWFFPCLSALAIWFLLAHLLTSLVRKHSTGRSSPAPAVSVDFVLFPCPGILPLRRFGSSSSHKRREIRPNPKSARFSGRVHSAQPSFPIHLYRGRC